MKLRENVGLVIKNEVGLIFAGERSDIKDAWQMPQGGVDTGESLEIAAIREMGEETGIRTNFNILKISKNRYKYFKPLTREGIDYDGQIQTWFLINFTGKDTEIRLSKEEFINWSWLPVEEIIKRAVLFKRKIYEQIFKEFEIY